MPDTLTGRLNARDRDRDQPSIIRLWTVGKKKWIRSALCRGARGACSMPLSERISRDPSGTTLSWQCRFSTTNAMYESLGLCHCFLFSGLVEYYFPREGAKYTHTHNTHTHAHTYRHRRLWDWIDYLSIFRVKNEVSVAKIASIILSIFRVKTIDYRFRFLE